MQSSCSSCIWFSRQNIDAADVPGVEPGRRRSPTPSTPSSTWVVGILDGPAVAFKDFITYGLLNPMQNLLAESPWWLAALAISAIGAVLGGMQGAGPHR